MNRSSGLLLHVTSLPGDFGIGDLGPSAYTFVDHLQAAKQSIWQVLPLVPVGYGNSPYASPSTFAGNTLLISPELLLKDKLITQSDLKNAKHPPGESIDFAQVRTVKRKLLEIAFARFEDKLSKVDETSFELFCHEQSYWLDDFCLFAVLKEHHDFVSWTDWADKYARKDPEAIRKFVINNERRIRMSKFWQFLFFSQWIKLRAYCHSKGIQILGDLPIYVAHDSADVWANPELFLLEEDGQPTVVAGVPPDYFSETGQRWGNPIYNWDLMHHRGYQWWTLRMKAILKTVDIIRLDHFRGFEAFWAVPASEPTAQNGEWLKGPGSHLLDHLAAVFNGVPPIVAEDLGVITDGVLDLMHRYQFPGMAILQFGFDDGPTGKFLPHNFKRNLVAYTGTHDNDTVVGWYNTLNGNQAPGVELNARKYCREYLPISDLSSRGISHSFVRSLLASVANVAIVPVQDLLGLGSDARMNTPGKTDGNWQWRMKDHLDAESIEYLSGLTETFGRAAI